MSRNLFPKIASYKQEWLEVDDTHRLYVEQSGNPDGIPVLYLHGGPGGGSSENHRRYFDPDKYRIIIFDQRGCGKSMPSPSTQANTTEELIKDIEAIRCHVNVDKWLVAGGSWGTTLAMLYGIAHADKVLGFILRGVFLATQAEYQWLYNENGAASFFPEFYQDFLAPLADEDKQTPLKGYQKIFASDNEVAKIAASKAWYLWELRLSTIEHHQLAAVQIEDTHQAHCMAEISQHYFAHQSFISEDFIIENIDKISAIPAIVIHGRYDMVCQLTHAYRLTSAWQNASLQILPQAGHSGFERQTIDAMCKATDVMANFLQENNE